MTLDDLIAQRAAIPDDGALPAATSRNELEALRAKRRQLDQRLRQAREAQVILSSLPAPEDDETW